MPQHRLEFVADVLTDWADLSVSVYTSRLRRIYENTQKVSPYRKINRIQTCQ